MRRLVFIVNITGIGDENNTNLLITDTKLTRSLSLELAANRGLGTGCVSILGGPIKIICFVIS